jgi:hypothetical protein
MTLLGGLKHGMPLRSFCIEIQKIHKWNRKLKIIKLELFFTMVQPIDSSVTYLSRLAPLSASVLQVVTMQTHAIGSVALVQGTAFVSPKRRKKELQRMVYVLELLKTPAAALS